MKLSIITAGLFLSACISVGAQTTDEDVKKKASEGNALKTINDTGWVRGGFFATNFSNTTFSNWAQGGTNNTAIVATASLFAIHRHKSGKQIWENYLDLAYGLMRNGDGKIDDPANPSQRITNPFIKNEDKLVFLTKYGRRINDKLNYSVLFSLNTQMFPGYEATDVLRRNSHVSNLMAQGFGYLSVGIDYKPTSYFSVYVSPVTAKYTVVREQRLADLGLYGMTPAEYDTTGSYLGVTPKKLKNGQTFRQELGWYINLGFNKEVVKNISWQSRLEFFQNYKTMDFDRIDVNWQNTINMKVNKYISVSLINQIIWDYDVDTISDEEGVQRNWQLKNFFGVGFSAKFGDPL
ncbi:MAG: DUF3078 domain-containing protein [Bacteroidetes bacterium]|nr:DUF3078 domain-containing protein [Bacteroidota bacterium]